MSKYEELFRLVLRPGDGNSPATVAVLQVQTVEGIRGSIDGNIPLQAGWSQSAADSILDRVEKAETLDRSRLDSIQLDIETHKYKFMEAPRLVSAECATILAEELPAIARQIQTGPSFNDITDDRHATYYALKMALEPAAGIQALSQILRHELDSRSAFLTPSHELLGSVQNVSDIVNAILDPSFDLYALESALLKVSAGDEIVKFGSNGVETVATMQVALAVLNSKTIEAWRKTLCRFHNHKIVVEALKARNQSPSLPGLELQTQLGTAREFPSIRTL